VHGFQLLGKIDEEDIFNSKRKFQLFSAVIVDYHLYLYRILSSHLGRYEPTGRDSKLSLIIESLYFETLIFILHNDT